jgi:hypothetical protein
MILDKKYLIENDIMFRCKTLSAAKFLLSIFAEMGFHWYGCEPSDLSYLNYWDEHKEETCYGIYIEDIDYLIESSSLSYLKSTHTEYEIVDLNYWRIKNIAKELISEKSYV